MISSENPREIAHIAEIMMKEIDILNEKYAICIADSSGEFKAYRHQVANFAEEREDIKAIHQLMIEDLKQKKWTVRLKKIHFTLSMILKHLLIARIFRKMMLKTYYKRTRTWLEHFICRHS